MWLRKSEERVAIIVYHRHVSLAKGRSRWAHANKGFPVDLHCIEQSFSKIVCAKSIGRDDFDLPVFCMIPHARPHHTSHSITAKDNVADFSRAIAELDLDATTVLPDLFCGTACPYKALIWQVVVQYLKKLSSFKQQNVLTMATDNQSKTSLMACYEKLHQSSPLASLISIVVKEKNSSDGRWQSYFSLT